MPCPFPKVLTRPANDQNTSDRRAGKLTYRFFGKVDMPFVDVVVVQRPLAVQMIMVVLDYHGQSSTDMACSAKPQGILQASGEDWRQQHRVMYKAFASHNLGSFRPAYAARAQKLIETLLKQQGNGKGCWLDISMVLLTSN
jgi:cytochrome P450